MKIFKNFLLPCFVSFLISFSIFFLTMTYTFIPKNSNYKTVQKNESLVPYFIDTDKNIALLISIENCPIRFLINIAVKQKNVSVNHITNFSDKEKSFKNITFNLSGFENTVNFLGGIEIETPYGVPSPYKNQTIIAKDENLLVFGASIGEIITNEAQPSTERKEYYCYILEELCIKFLSGCTPESYKVLKQNSETDISYTEFYDNYKLLNNIKR